MPARQDRVGSVSAVADAACDSNGSCAAQVLEGRERFLTSVFQLIIDLFEVAEVHIKLSRPFV